MVLPAIGSAPPSSVRVPGPGRAPAAPPTTPAATGADSWQGAGSPLAPPVDLEYTSFAPEMAAASSAEYLKYATANGGKPKLVPLGSYDPSKPAVVVVPGIGMTFRDLHGLAELRNQYQVLVMVTNDNRPGEANVQDAATLMEQYAAWRDRQAAATGATPDRTLRIIGHSYGSFLAPLVLQKLTDRHELSTGPGSLFSKVQFVGLDGPWAGLDLPWIATAPGVGWVVDHVLSHVITALPGHHPYGGFSVVNRTPTMEDLRNLEFPANVTTQLVTVRHPVSPLPAKAGWMARARASFLDPVHNAYSAELAPGDLQRLWDFLKTGDTNLNDLDSWKLDGLMRSQRMGNLLHALRLDADYPARAAELVQAARTATSLQQFGAAWDKVVGEVITTFEGQHTQFMWTDPRFLPWLRTTLEAMPPDGTSTTPVAAVGDKVS